MSTRAARTWWPVRRSARTPVTSLIAVLVALLVALPPALAGTHGSWSSALAVAGGICSASTRLPDGPDAPDSAGAHRCLLCCPHAASAPPPVLPPASAPAIALQPGVPPVMAGPDALPWQAARARGPPRNAG